MKYPQIRGRILIYAIICSLVFSGYFPIFSVEASTDQPAPTESEVLVIYNSSYATDSDSNSVQDSRQIAEYYQSKRPGVTVTSAPCEVK
jgi:hypothetical protein